MNGQDKCLQQVKLRKGDYVVAHRVEGKHMFSLMSARRSTCFQARDEPSKVEWMRALHLAILQLSSG